MVGQGLRIRLRLPSELDHVPWELLLNPETGLFFSTSEWTPIVRYPPVENPRAHEGVSLPLRILAVVSSPQDVFFLDTESEWEKLKANLDELIIEELVVLDRLEKPTYEALQSSLRTQQYHVLHFVGHGFFDRDSGQSGLLFEGEDGDAHSVDADALAGLLNNHPTLTLAFLNACDTGRATSSEVFVSVVHRLMQGGLPAAIAMQAKLSDHCAISLSQTFYKAVADGYNVEAALAEARKNLVNWHETEWAIPVLFSRLVDSQLIEAQEREALPPEFLVDEEELERLVAVFQAPDEAGLISKATKSLNERRLLIIVGDLGIGKQTLALHLAKGLLDVGKTTTVIRTYRDTAVKELRHLRETVIIFPDMLGYSQWDRKNIEQEIAMIEHLQQKNWLILTSNTQVLEEALQETRLEEWTPVRESRVDLTSAGYSEAARAKMINRHLNQALEQARVNEGQAKRLTDVLSETPRSQETRAFLASIQTPMDIRRLISDRLPRIRNRHEFRKMIRQSADLGSEILAWFRSIGGDSRLGDDLQCFLLVLAIFHRR